MIEKPRRWIIAVAGADDVLIPVNSAGLPDRETVFTGTISEVASEADRRVYAWENETGQLACRVMYETKP